MNYNSKMRGRFAPTPSGPLHLGSLVAALASYADIKIRGGEWLLRIEDVDKTRSRKIFEEQILAELERHALYWDGPIVRQSERDGQYQRALDQLQEKSLVYACSCSRRKLQELRCPENSEGELVYPGVCRMSGALTAADEFPSKLSIRFRVQQGTYQFVDEWMGECRGCVADEVGDFVVRRADGCFTYHLAVVVDDHLQGIDRVVRGRDILPLTGRHLLLQRALGYGSPAYVHLPLVLSEDGDKLSKSRSAAALSKGCAIANLCLAVKHLGLDVKKEDFATPAEVVQFAVNNWHSIDRKMVSQK